MMKTKKTMATLLALALFVTCCSTCFAIEVYPATGTKMKIYSRLDTSKVVNLAISQYSTPSAGDNVTLYSYSNGNWTKWWTTNIYTYSGGIPSYTINLYQYGQYLLYKGNSGDSSTCAIESTSNQYSSKYTVHWSNTNTIAPYKYEIYLFNYNLFLKTVNSTNSSDCRWASISSPVLDNYLWSVDTNI